MVEKPAYRDNLEQILDFLKGKYNDNRQMLNIKDVREFSGRSYEYIKKTYFEGKDFISAASFARMLS